MCYIGGHFKEFIGAEKLYPPNVNSSLLAGLAMQYCHSWLFKQKSNPKFPCEKWTPCALVLLCTVSVIHQQDPTLGIASVNCLENPTGMMYMKITPHKKTTLVAKNQIKKKKEKMEQLYYIHGAPNAKYSMYNISTFFFFNFFFSFFIL